SRGSVYTQAMTTRPVDLRSDSVTQPTEGMLAAMMSAEVGDDILGDDPTVKALEARAASFFGHEAAVFCPSGTMTNQVALVAHCRPGDEIVCSEEAHIYHYEGGGMAATAGASARLLPGHRGRFEVDAVRRVVMPDDPHFPSTKVVAIEDTVNRGGGAIWDFGVIEGLRALCSELGLILHVDGARLFNRLVARGEVPSVYGRRFDSISVCLSKGLGAPVGSILIGSADFIHRARRVRKRMGGAMRQAGYLAAAGLYALEHHIERLVDDHRRASVLAQVLAASPKVAAVTPPETNIVMFRPGPGSTVASWLAHFKAHDVWASGIGIDHVRLVTHLQVDDDGLGRACDAIQAYG
ncbi:MAG: GntG family PLP-dependent aldolase, partial [Myxococcota bacterium]